MKLTSTRGYTASVWVLVAAGMVFVFAAQYALRYASCTFGILPTACDLTTADILDSSFTAGLIFFGALLYSAYKRLEAGKADETSD